MSGRKRLISALLALAMVGQLGMVVGMADDALPLCGSADHGMSSPVANVNGCENDIGVHWIASSKDSLLLGGNGINYYYPSANTASINCSAALKAGTKNIIIFESKGSIPSKLTVNYFSPDSGDKIILPKDVYDEVSGEDGIMALGDELYIGENGKYCIITFNSVDAEEVTIEPMPTDPHSFSLGKDTAGNITVSPKNDSDFIYLWKLKQGTTDSAYTKTAPQPPASSVYTYSCTAVEKATGRRFAASSPCLVTPQIVSVTATCNGSPVNLTDGVLLGAGETKSYTLVAEVAYSGHCGDSTHAAGSSHGNTTAWEATKAPAGVTVKNGVMTIEGAKLTAGAQEVTLRAAVGSQQRSVTFHVQKLEIADAAKNGASASGEIAIDNDSPTEYTYSVNVPDGKAELYTFDWTLAKKQGGSQPAPGYIKVTPNSGNSASATVTIDKELLPKEGLDKETFVLTVTLTPKSQSYQARGIAAFAVRAINGNTGDPISVDFEITVSAAAAAEDDPEAPDDSGSTDPSDSTDPDGSTDTTDPSGSGDGDSGGENSSGGDNSEGSSSDGNSSDGNSSGGDSSEGNSSSENSSDGSSSGGNSSEGNSSSGSSSEGNSSSGNNGEGNSSGGNSSGGSSGSGSGDSSGITVTSSNTAAPHEININSSSAATVSYTYTAAVFDSGQYHYAWTLVKKSSQQPAPDYISVTPEGNPATVTVTKAKLPANGVDETFELTVTATPIQQTAVEKVIAFFATLSTGGEKTYKFDIRLRAAAKSVSSSSSSGGSDRGSDDSDWYQWKSIEKQIDRASKGSTVKASLGSNTDMPFYILDALRGEDVSLQMKISGNYTWTIGGRTVQPTPQNLIWVPLGIKSYSNSKMTALCRESRIKGFQLENTDSFYGDMRLTMNLGSSYAKKTVYLYSYDESRNRLTYASSARVADNGDVDFVFTRSLGTYAVTSKALYGESAVGTGGGTVGSGNKPTTVYPPVVSLPASQAPASSSSNESSSSSESASPSSEPSSAPDLEPTPVDTSVQPEPEDASIPIIVPMLILAIAGVITATVVVVNSSRNKGSFDIE